MPHPHEPALRQKINVVKKMYQKFTDRARKVMQLANEAALSFGANASIDTHHLLLGLTKEGSGVAAHVLRDLGLSESMIYDAAQQLGHVGQYREMTGKLSMTTTLQEAVEHSLDEAAKLSHHYVGTEHLLLALAILNEGAAAEIFSNLGIDRDDVRRRVLEILGHSIDR